MKGRKRLLDDFQYSGKGGPTKSSYKNDLVTIPVSSYGEEVPGTSRSYKSPRVQLKRTWTPNTINNNLLNDDDDDDDDDDSDSDRTFLLSDNVVESSSSDDEQIFDTSMTARAPRPPSTTPSPTPSPTPTLAPPPPPPSNLRKALNPNQSKKHSIVWEYFTLDKEKKEVKCKCGCKLKYIQRSTSNMNNHIKTKHTTPMKHKDAMKKQTILNFTAEKKIASEEEAYAELVALDGFSVSAVANSRFIQSSMRLRGFPGTARRHTVMEKIKHHFTETKEKIQSKLAEAGVNGERFSITFDEWTSLAKRRYLNINIHGNEGEIINLGMVRIWGGQKSETLLKLVTDKLAEFNVDIEKAISITTDGPSIMVKLGKLAPPLHQLCLAHALHLAVSKLLYVKKTKSKNQDEWADDSNETDDDEFTNNNADYEDIEDGEQIEDDEEETEKEDDPDYEEMLEISSNLTEEGPQIVIKYREAISKLRTIVKKYRKSPILREELEKRVSDANLEKYRSLKLDVKTRWNSLVEMISDYLKVHDVVSDHLRELKFAYQVISTSELALLKELEESLLPVKRIGEELAKREINILKADLAMGFLIDSLQKKPENSFARSLADSLHKYYQKRRLTHILQLMHHLNTDKRRYVSKSLPLSTGRLIMIFT